MVFKYAQITHVNKFYDLNNDLYLKVSKIHCCLIFNLKESPEENRNDHMYVYYLGAPEILPGKKGGL
jgi:hypothetical protein